VKSWETSGSRQSFDSVPCGLIAHLIDSTLQDDIAATGQRLLKLW
jgi:hypothetical protein